MRLAILLTLAAACDNLPQVASTEAAELSCYKFCQRDAQCGANERCWNHRCRIKSEVTFCVDPHTSGNLGGDRVACNAYYCDGSTGLCNRTCAATSDCTGGFICDTMIGHCVTAAGQLAPADTWLPPAEPTHESDAPLDCRQLCSTDFECFPTAQYMCHNGVCMPRVPHCDTDTFFETSVGVGVPCQPYKCNYVRSACATSCLGSDECAGGNACEVDYSSPVAYTCHP